LLSPVRHRSAEAQAHLTRILARAVLVGARTALVNAIRGLTKAYGERLRTCHPEQIRKELATELSSELRTALEPLFQDLPPADSSTRCRAIWANCAYLA